MSVIRIDDLDVIFPFPQAYPEQIQYMTQLKLSLDAGGPCLLEMPSGTGKTVCLLSLILAYMSQNEHAGPLIYNTRTIPELNQGIEELKRVNKARREISDLQFDKDFLGISLACRYYYCVNQEAAEQKYKKDVDIQCRTRTIKNDDKHCDFFDHVLLRPRAGIYGIDDLRAFGAANGLCPYFLSKRLVKEAQVIFCTFAYTLDYAASEVVFKNCEKSAIVVYDEAHNIDDVCCEFMSMFITQNTLDLAAIGVDAAQEKLYENRDKEMTKLQNVFDRMKNQLKAEEDNNFFATSETMDMISRPSLPDKILKMAMPSSIRNFDTFIKDTKKLIKFLSGFIQGIEKPTQDLEVDSLMNSLTSAQPTTSFVDIETERYPPRQILGLIQKKCGITPQELHCMGDRLSKFIVDNKVPGYERFSALFDVMEFVGLLGTYDNGFTVFVENGMNGKQLTIACLDCTLAFEPVIRHFKRIVITSGTLSPLSFYPRLLNFDPVAAENFTMSLSRQCLLPLVVSRGYMQAPITSSFKSRDNPNVLKGYGILITEYCKIVPDGIVCFFPSYTFMNQLLKEWMSDEIMNEICRYKLVFIETPNAEETNETLYRYRCACDSGRGALLLGVARGRASEGIDFSDHYGRCCILIGLPIRNTQSIIVQARADYIEKKLGIRKEDFLVFDAMRAASQCVGRLLRSKKDYGVVVMADRRYAKNDCLSQMPHWISEFLDHNNYRGSCIEETVKKTRDFMLQMAQPFTLDINSLKQLEKKDKLNDITKTRSETIID